MYIMYIIHSSTPTLWQHKNLRKMFNIIWHFSACVKIITFCIQYFCCYYYYYWCVVAVKICFSILKTKPCKQYGEKEWYVILIYLVSKCQEKLWEIFQIIVEEMEQNLSHNTNTHQVIEFKHRIIEFTNRNKQTTTTRNK